MVLLRALERAYVNPAPLRLLPTSASPSSWISCDEAPRWANSHGAKPANTVERRLFVAGSGSRRCLEPAIQGPSVDAEHPCGVRLVSVDARQNVTNVAPLHLVEGDHLGRRLGHEL